MPAEKATALVVRGSDWSETSRIATLFTREHGKVRALAKGGRRLKSSFEIAFDLLAVCRVVYLRSRSGGLDLLTEAQVAERFTGLRSNLRALYGGYYVAELLSDGTQDYDPHPALFDAAVEALRRLAAVGAPRAVAEEPPPPGPDASGARATLDVVSRFELVWLRELGYGPRLDTCAGCGTAAVSPSATAGVPYSASMGGVVCPACEPAVRDRRWLTPAALSALRELAANAVAPEWDGAVRRELRPLLGQAVAYVLGRRPRMLAYVEAP